MPSFDAGSVVEPLHYRLRPYANLEGTIREPTDRQVAEYQAAIRKLVRDYRDKLPAELVTGTPDAADLVSAAGDFDADTLVAFHADLAAIFAALCSDNPGRDAILSLPMRPRALFYNWLSREVMSPEAAPGGGSAQVTPLRSAAAG